MGHNTLYPSYWQVIQHWVDTWTANTTQDEFKEVLEALCQKLDRPQRVKHCLHIVDDYYIPWFNFILHEINPRQICSMVGLCGGNGFMKVMHLDGFIGDFSSSGPDNAVSPTR